MPHENQGGFLGGRSVGARAVDLPLPGVWVVHGTGRSGADSPASSVLPEVRGFHAGFFLAHRHGVAFGGAAMKTGILFRGAGAEPLRLWATDGPLLICRAGSPAQGVKEKRRTHCVKRIRESLMVNPLFLA